MNDKGTGGGGQCVKMAVSITGTRDSKRGRTKKARAWRGKGAGGVVKAHSVPVLLFPVLLGCVVCSSAIVKGRVKVKIRVVERLRDLGVRVRKGGSRLKCKLFSRGQ